MIIEGGRVAPYFVAAEFYQACAQHDAADEPLKEEDNGFWRRLFWEGAWVEERAEEDGEEAGFEKLDLPAVAVPFLADVDEGHV